MFNKPTKREMNMIYKNKPVPSKTNIAVYTLEYEGNLYWSIGTTTDIDTQMNFIAAQWKTVPYIELETLVPTVDIRATMGEIRAMLATSGRLPAIISQPTIGLLGYTEGHWYSGGFPESVMKMFRFRVPKQSSIAKVDKWVAKVAGQLINDIK